MQKVGSKLYLKSLRNVGERHDNSHLSIGAYSTRLFTGLCVKSKFFWASIASNFMLCFLFFMIIIPFWLFFNGNFSPSCKILFALQWVAYNDGKGKHLPQKAIIQICLYLCHRSPIQSGSWTENARFRFFSVSNVLQVTSADMRFHLCNYWSNLV